MVIISPFADTDRFLLLYIFNNCGDSNRQATGAAILEAVSFIRKISDTNQFLWVTIDPTYKLTTRKLSVHYALFTYVSIAVSDYSILNTRIKN
jgi:hypothetical protein